MELKPEELVNRIKRGEALPNLLAVIGENTYYRNKVLKAIKQHVFKEINQEDWEVSEFSKDTNLVELETTINSYPFFCGKSLIEISDEKLWAIKQEAKPEIEKMPVNKKSKKASVSKENLAPRDKLNNLLLDIPEYCTVILCGDKLAKSTKLYKTISAKGIVCACEQIKTSKLGPWLYAEAQALGGRLDSSAVNLIMEYLAPVDNAPLEFLHNELEKIALYAGDRKRWTKSDVEAVFADLPEVSAWAINNALGERKLLNCLELLAREKKNRNSFFLVVLYSLMSTLRRMLMVNELERQGLSYQSMAANYNINEYAAKKVSQQLRNYSIDKIQNALLEMSDINMEFRSGGRQWDRLEEILVRLMS